jgi:AAA domain
MIAAMTGAVDSREPRSAHGGRQAEHLADALGIETRVVAGRVTLLDHTGDPADVWAPGTVLILDEATQVSTRR